MRWQGKVRPAHEGDEGLSIATRLSPTAALLCLLIFLLPMGCALTSPKTPPPLSKPHARLACNACHGDNYTLKTPDSCRDCHAERYAPGVEHRVGMPAPEGVKDLPLGKGRKVECYTCHGVHLGDMSYPSLLRMPADRLCIACHAVK